MLDFSRMNMCQRMGECFVSADQSDSVGLLIDNGTGPYPSAFVSNNNQNTTTASLTALPLYTWTHLVFTYNYSLGGVLYANLNLIGSSPSMLKARTFTCDQCYIGASSPSGSSAAYFDDLMFFNMGFNPTQIATIYSSVFFNTTVTSVPSYSLFALGISHYWRFNVQSNLSDLIQPNQQSIASSSYNFTTDYWGNAQGAIYLNSVFIQLPVDVYFAGYFTITGWVFVQAVSNGQRVIDCGSADYENNVVLSVQYNSTSLAPFGFVSSDAMPSSVFSASSLTLRVWTHLAFSVNPDGNGYLLINGARVGSAPVTAAPYVVRESCLIGLSNSPYDGLTNVALDELMIFNTPLTTAQISQVITNFVITSTSTSTRTSPSTSTSTETSTSTSTSTAKSTSTVTITSTSTSTATSTSTTTSTSTSTSTVTNTSTSTRTSTSTETSTSTSTRAVVPSSLVKYWNFNNNYVDSVTGIALDSFSNFAGYVNDRNGRSSSAIYLNGGYATIPSEGCPSANSIMSTAAWVYITAFPSICSGIFYLNNGNFDWFFCNREKRLYLQIDANAIFMNYVLSTNSWVHLGMVINSGSTSLTFYVNGAVDSTTSMTPIRNYGNTCYLAHPDYPFYGYIDDLMFFSTSLTASQMLSVMSYNYYDTVIPSGLINYWNFNNNYVDSVTKYELNSFVNLNGYVSDRNGRANSAIYLNGGYATIPSAGCPAVSSIKSTAVWVYITALSGCPFIIDLSNNKFRWYFCSDKKVRLYASADYSMTSLLSTYTWTHLGMVINSGQTSLTFYVNGAVDSTLSITPFSSSGSECYLAYPGNPFNGYMDDLMIFSTSLTASEMLSVKSYNYYEPVMPSGLINYWDFNNNYLDSKTGYELNSVLGLVGYVSDRNGRSSSAIYLNGGWATIPSAGCPAASSIKSTAVWVYITAFQSCCCSNIFTLSQFQWYFCPDLQQRGQVTIDTGITTYSTGYVLSANRWNHLGTVINSGQTSVTFYVNEAVDSTRSITPFSSSGSTCYLAYPESSYAFYGYMDDLMIFSTSLSDSQMLSVTNYYY